MADKKGFWEVAFLHPFLFAFYPLLALWVTNIAQIPAYAITRAAFIILLFLVFALIVSLLLFRSLVKAAVFTSLFMLLFLTYGHIFALVDMKSILGFVIGRHRYTIPLWFGLLAVGGFFLLRAKTPPYALNRILNLVSVLLFVFASVQVISYEARTGMKNFQVGAAHVKKPAQTQAAPANGPDVYYILVDGYSRADVMKELGGPDVSGFMNELTKMGFTVIQCAQDNYDRTPVSLTSSLNMNYLEPLKVREDANENSLRAADMAPLIAHSQSRQKFEELGYQFVTFKGVYAWLNVNDSDYYYDSEDIVPIYNKLEAVNFQYLFLSTTMMRPLMEAQVAMPKSFEKLPVFVLQLLYPKADIFTTREYKTYRQNLYALQKLSEAPSLPGKKFVYAHLFLTHQPYVFFPDGSFRYANKDGKEAYFMQIEYANKRLPEVIRKILHDSKTPPVIVIQSDHGYPETPERVRILNAYYLPPASGATGTGKELYPGITPVNTFRLILNRYFNSNLPLLPDNTFHSNPAHQYQFEPIPPSCPTAAR